MKYSILSSLEYLSGRILLFCSRFDNFFTGNNQQSPEFCRSCLQWVSGKQKEDIVSVLCISNTNQDNKAIDSSYKTITEINELDSLSDLNYLTKFNVICLFGFDNNISPLIRSNIETYVSNGGGLVISDINVSESDIYILENMSSVYCQSSGVNFQGGGRWSYLGTQSEIYSSDFRDSKIIPLNSILESDLSNNWNMLYYYDTDVNLINDFEIDESIEGPSYLSSNYDILGTNIIGYFSSSYKNGAFEVKE